MPVETPISANADREARGAVGLTRKEAASVMGFSEVIVRKLAKSGVLPTIAADDGRVDALALREMLAARGITTAPLDRMIAEKRGEPKPPIRLQQLDDEQLLTMQKIGDLLGLSQRTVQKRIDSGKISRWYFPEFPDRRATLASVLAFCRSVDFPTENIEEQFPQTSIALLGDASLAHELDAYLPHQREGKPTVEPVSAISDVHELMKKRRLAAVLMSREGQRAMGQDLPAITDALDAPMIDEVIPPYVLVGDDEYDAAEWDGIARRKCLPVALAVDRKDPANAARKIAELLGWELPGHNGSQG